MRDFRNERIELLPHVDLWMRGARYGTIVKNPTRRDPCYRVKLDKLSKVQRVHPDSFRFLGELAEHVR